MKSTTIAQPRPSIFSRNTNPGRRRRFASKQTTSCSSAITASLTSMQGHAMSFRYPIKTTADLPHRLLFLSVYEKPSESISPSMNSKALTKAERPQRRAVSTNVYGIEWELKKFFARCGRHRSSHPDGTCNALLQKNHGDYKSVLRVCCDQTPSGRSQVHPQHVLY